MRLRQRVALITGGGSGIGRAIATLFASEGASIVAVDLAADAAAETASLVHSTGGAALGVQADVSDTAAVEHAVTAARAKFGTIDILVNNAGISDADTVLDLDEAAWSRNVDVVLKSVFLCSRAVLPGMIERKNGVILNIASVNGMTALGESSYSAAKAGVINLTANMAIHFGDKGIRVNCIAPGTVRTPIWKDRVKKNPAVFDKLIPWYALGRVGEVDDIAKPALFLCCDDSAWITGVTLPVDGGLTCGAYRFHRELHKEID